MRRRAWVVGIGIAAGLSVGCAARQSWRLVQPPEMADTAAPGGTRLLPHAALDDWSVVDTYGSEGACVEAQEASWKEEVVRARAEAGDDAKYDLGLRRAVHARCVPVPGR